MKHGRISDDQLMMLDNFGLAGMMLFLPSYSAQKICIAPAILRATTAL